MNGKTIVGISLATLGIVGALACGGPGKDDKTTTQVTVATSGGPGQTVGEAAGKTAAAVAKAVELRSGTWKVPTEIKPGTYVTTAGTGLLGGCYWARVKSFDGEMNSLIANGLVEAGSRGRFTVKASDKGVELTGDCVWTKA